MQKMEHIRGASESWLNLVETLFALARCQVGGLLFFGEAGVGKRTLWDIYFSNMDAFDDYVLIDGDATGAFQTWREAFDHQIPFFIHHWNTWPEERIQLAFQLLARDPAWDRIPWGASLLENNPEQARAWLKRNRHRFLRCYLMHVPPLRERTEDITVIAQALLLDTAEHYNKPARGWTPEAMDLLRRHPWWGNVRELTEVVKHAVLRHRNGLLIDEDTLRKAIRQARYLGASSDIYDRIRVFVHRMFQYLKEHPELSRNLKPWHYVLDEIRHHATLSILQLTHQNEDEAARILGINRRTLRRYARNRHSLSHL